MESDDLPDDLLERYRGVSVATVWSGLDELHGYQESFMQGVFAQTAGEKLVGRARTLRFVPPRPDLWEETPAGADAPEAMAMARCGRGDVLVCDVGGSRYSSSGGEMKLLQLQMNEAEGVVTDGAIRDITGVRRMGFKIFAAGGNRSPPGRRPSCSPTRENGVIQCGGIAVRPGDLIVGNDDGIVCVPKQWAAKVLEWVEEHDYLEGVILDMVLRDGVPPTTYYNAAMFERLRAERSARSR